MDKIRDWAEDKVEYNKKILNKFKLSIFWIIWYKPSKNDADLIDFLNEFRKQNNTKVFEAIDNKNYNPKLKKSA